MYQKHKMNVIGFDSVDVFADLEFASEVEDGESAESYKPGYSDKQGKLDMYEKHEMDVIHYEKNAFVVASGLGEGAVEGPDLPVLEDDE